jgi:pimeloyl-ACP methyl ester carboxylesterase
VATAPARVAGTSDAVQGGAEDDYGAGGRSEWLDIDWHKHQRWVRVRGRAVNVIELGEGPPLLFVHGHSGRWANWLENIPHFARTRRVVAPDLPGFGASEMPADGVSIANYARVLDELCGLLDIDAAAVVGNSMGGFVSAELAIKFPARVERLGLVSAAGLSTKYVGVSSEFFRRRSVGMFARAINAYAAIPEARAQTLVRRRRLRRRVLDVVAAHPERLSAPICAELLRGSGRPAAPDATDAIMTYDFRDRVTEIACPTLIVWGEKDRVVPVESAHEYEQLIPDTRKEIFADTGHVAMVERPARFNRVLQEFLEEGPAG